MRVSVLVAFGLLLSLAPSAAGAEKIGVCMAVTGATFVSGTSNSLAVKDGVYFPFPGGQMLRCQPNVSGVEYAIGMIEHDLTGTGGGDPGEPAEITFSDSAMLFSYGFGMVLTAWVLGIGFGLIFDLIRKGR